MTAGAVTAAPQFLARGNRAQRSLDEQPFQKWTSPEGRLWASLYRQSGSYLVRFPALADFEVTQDGCVIEAWEEPGVDPATVEHLYLNQVLPLALTRQGKLVLHGSAVEFNEECIAFIGPSGRGKSTLAASFAKAGYRFLTDDGLHVEWSDGHLLANPSHPSIRLWRDSQQALAPEALSARSLQFTTKSRLLATDELRFCETPRRISGIYLLGSGECERTVIRPAKPSTAVMQLLSSSFLLDIDRRDAIAQHFDQLSLVANMPFHYHLDYPRRYEALEAVRNAILGHVEQGPRAE